MGEMLAISCPACGFERGERSGVGMLGVETVVCICTTCADIVTIDRVWRPDLRTPEYIEFLRTEFGASVLEELRCPTCSSHVVPILPDENDDEDDQDARSRPDEVPVACPACNGALDVTDVGLWD